MKIRLLKLTSFLLFIISNSLAQNFEGKIVYKNSFKSKMPNITDQQFDFMMGTSMNYFIKDGNYKSETNGTFLQWQLYINKDNKVYTKAQNSEAVYWKDGSENVDEVTKAEINKEVATILGYVCDELILTCKSGTQKYYFNSKIKADSKLFENHKFGNWSEVLSRSKALPLKIIVENTQFIIESIAIEISPMRLLDVQFELPANSKIEKSPY